MLAPMRLARLRRRQAAELHRCLACGGDFVHPVCWHEADETHWWVRLRCGECGSWRDGRFTDEVVQRFDRRLDEEAERIADAADRLHREWRSTEADVFAAALHRDLIDVGDFTR
jgi:hypothetical protein